MTLKQWLTVVATAFVGGAWAYISAHLATGLPSSGQQWLAFGVGALVAGLGAVIHLYQTAPPDAAIVKASKLAAKIIPLAVIAAGSSMLACSGCQNGQVPGPVVPSVNLAVCIFDNYATSASCRPTGNWVQCVATIANACGADAAAVEQVLTAQRKAMVADGYVLPPRDGGQ